MGVTSENPIRVVICQLATGGAVGSWTSWTTMMTTTTWATAKDGPKWSAGVTRGSLGVLAVPTNRSLTARRNPRGRYKTTKQIVGQNNPRTGAPHPKGQNPEGTEATLLAMELAGTVPAGDLLACARIRGGDGYAYVVVNRQVNGNVIVRRETDGARATLRPTDRVIRTARSRMRDYMPPAMVRRSY